MKNKFTIRLVASLLVLMLFVQGSLAQECALNGGEPHKPTKITFSSLSGTATLIGFSEYTNPSVPAKKYRVKKGDGSTYFHLFWSQDGSCTNLRWEETRTYSGTATYDKNTGVLTNNLVGGMDNNACVSLIVESTVQMNIVSGGCSTCWWFPYDQKAITATKTESLSEEDTEEDAEKRAVVTAGTSNTAYRTGRTTGFSFSFSKVHYEAAFNVDCAGEYDGVVTYSTVLRVAPFTTGTDIQVVRKTLQPGKHTITGDIRVKEKDTDYTVESIELRKPCGKLKEAGTPDFSLDSVHVELSLGLGARQESAGFLSLKAEVIASALYAPAALTVATPDGGVETVRDGAGALRQVKAPQALADIVTLAASSYEVRFYAPADVGAQDSVTKIYAVSGTPYVTYKFENPDAGGTTRLQITETRGSSAKVSEYSYNSGTNTWALGTGTGLRQESLAIATAGGDTTKTSTISDGTTAVSKVAKTYRAYPWGEELISEVTDPDGAALTTTSDFYSNQAADGGAYGQLKQRTNANGSWERHTYDSTGRPLKTIRPFLDAAVTAVESTCRVTELAYTSLADADGDGLPEQLTTTTETTLGTETGRSHLVEWSKPVTLSAETFARRSDIRCVTAGAAWDAADNLVTETLTYTADPLNGRTRRVVNPDGTATLIAYTIAANGQQTTVTQTGQPNGALDAIVAGTRTTTITSAQGQVIGETATDIASNLVISAWTATLFDALGRPTRLDHADGTYETRDYACCGLASSRDRTGAVTTYTYDAIGRPTDVARAGLTTHTTYDAEGRVKTVSRIGSDSSSMLQATNTYDLAGRLTQRKDALDRATGSSEAFDSGTGHTTRTTTNPDGGTVIQVTARDGSLLSVAGTAAAPRAYEYGLESGQLFSKEIKVGEGGAVTEWTKTYTDFAGRSYKTVLADGATTQSYFNTAGQLVRQVDADGIATLFAYNAKGEQEVTAVDLNQDGVIDYAGTDRITKTVSAVTTNGAYTVQRSTTTVWETGGQDTPVTVSVSDQSADGLRSWQTVRGLTTTSVTALDGSGGRTVTTTAPDGVKTIQVYANDLLVSTTVKTAADAQLGAATYGYDAHNRQISATDARNGATTFAYFADDQLQSTTTPDPDASQSGPGYDPQTTTYAYDSAGRPSQVTEPDGGIKTTEYYPTGLIKKYTGARQYPEERTYDAQGRLKTLKTWQNYAGDTGTATTTWNYDAVRGFLMNKRYADNTGPAYTYKPSGRLLTRAWARGIVTTYGYNAAGDLTGVDYSDSTPDVTLAYDRAGRQLSRTDATGVCTWSYDASGQLKDEVYSTGLLNGLSVVRGFDTLSRLGSVSAALGSPEPGGGGSVLNQMSYQYDAASRLSVVSQGTNSATYGYLANSPLVESVTFRSGSAVQLTTGKAYDYLNRLASIVNAPANGPAQSVAYTYNSANQRIRATREDNAYWSFTYDTLGQVTGARKYLASGAALNGFDHAWTYDDIGNRKTSTANGQTATYTPSLLNQYANRSVPGTIDVLGEAKADSTVTLTVGNGLPQPLTRQGDLFFKQLNVDNSALAVGSSLKVTGVKNLVGPNGEDAVSELDRLAFTPKTPEIFAYDADGNQTGDGRWTYTWDGENRLITIETGASAAAVGVPRQKIEFVHDGQSRRVSEKSYSWNTATSTWSLTTSRRSLYNGLSLIAEIDDAGSPQRTFAWGLDLSGTLSGAGGVGGLLFASAHDSSPLSCAPIYDGSGNILGYVDLASGTTVAKYEYSAFGEAIVADGISAGVFPFGFSTKYACPLTKHIHYEFRDYDPPAGRWLSKDPFGEQGGVNLYNFVGNSPLNGFDYLGLWGSGDHEQMTRGAWVDANLPQGMQTYQNQMAAMLVRENRRVDDDWLELNFWHFNRDLDEDIEAAVRRYSSNLTAQRQRIRSWLAKPNKENCRNAMERMGNLSHAFQDYYSHAIVRTSDGTKNIGRLTGNPNAPGADMKPASWGGLTSRGEHGPKHLGGTIEPGDRAPDSADRKRQSQEFTAGEFRAFAADWWRVCECYAKEIYSN